MRIASFNLENLERISRAGVTLAQRASLLRPQLQRLRADIVCLQEVNSQRLPGSRTRSLLALDELLEGTRYQAYHCVSTAASAGGKLEGGNLADVHNLVILSRFPIAAHRQFHHSAIAAIDYRLATAIPAATSAQPVRFERPILLAEIDADGPGGKLFVLNAHFRAPLASPIPGQKEAPFVWKSTRGWAEGYFLSALKRSGQALEMRLAIDDLLDADPHARIIVCGDFNAEDHETPLKIVIGAEEDTGNGLLAYRSMAVLDRSLPTERRFSVLHHGRPQMLDHILASRSMLGRFVNLEAHNETLGDEIVGYARVEHSAGSYHAAVVAEFDDTASPAGAASAGATPS